MLRQRLGYVLYIFLAVLLMPAPPLLAEDEIPTIYLPIIATDGQNNSTTDENTAGEEISTIKSLTRGPMVLLMAGENSSRLRIAPPAGIVRNGRSSPQSARFQVNYNPTTCEGSLAPWPTEAKSAFEYTASIWAALIESAQTIEIDACWLDLPRGLLGAAGANTLVSNFTNSPVTDTWYPAALANALENQDLSRNDAEIRAFFNRNAEWYFGTDGNTPISQLDFVTVVLHELGHGLGFVGSMTVNTSTGQGEWGGIDPQPNFPLIYDRFTEDGNGQVLLAYQNNSLALGSALRGNANGVFFDGANAKAINNSNPVKLYAPSAWQQGSSYSHVDDIFDNTPNALMTWSLGGGESIHNPGSITLGMFKDMGWRINDPNMAPDLVVDHINVTEMNVQVVIKNQGAASVPANQGFWVDVYINPEQPPTQVNEIWNFVGTEGLVWGVDSTTTILEPSQSITLSIGDTYYMSNLSVFSGTIPLDAVIYAQVDSANANTNYGGVLENHEMVGGAYNNILGPVSRSVVAAQLNSQFLSWAHQGNDVLSRTADANTDPAVKLPSRAFNAQEEE